MPNRQIRVEDRVTNTEVKTLTERMGLAKLTLQEKRKRVDQGGCEEVSRTHYRGNNLSKKKRKEKNKKREEDTKGKNRQEEKGGEARKGWKKYKKILLCN